MKRPGINYLILAAVCILIVCVGMVSATQMHRPIANGTQNTCFSQTGCNLTGPASSNPLLSHKGYPALNRTGKIPGMMMNKTYRGYNSTAGFLQDGHITPGDRLINNTCAYHPGPAIAMSEEMGVNGTDGKNCLVNTTRTGIQPGCIRDGQTPRKGMMFHPKNQSVAVSIS